MGQPLPQRILEPTQKQLIKLNDMGITIDDEDSYRDNQTNKSYVKYKLPTGWRTVDNGHSHRH